MASSPSALSARIKEQARRLGFDLVGIAPVRPSDHGEFYRRWLAEGRHGAMAYLAREDAVARRLDPQSAWPELRSAVVVGQSYYAGGGGGEKETSGAAAGGGQRGRIASDPSRGIIARYARGRDYHKVVKKKLLALLRWIEEEVGHELPAARAYVDTGPVLERELAQRAGLGWFGRNTMLIHPRGGSYFFLGSLLLELELEPDAPFAADRCGRCAACVAACPTGALLGRDANGAPVIDASRCIAYLTIELRGPIPRELRPGIGNRIFGCDVCQEVCPWNGPKFTQGRAAEGVDQAGEVGDDGGLEAAPRLVDLLAMTPEAWDAFSRGRAIRRAGYAGFRRNVAVALGNWLAGVDEPPAEAVAALVAALDDPEPLVRGHAAWALGRVGTADARRALEARLGVEETEWVREELSEALAQAARKP